MRVRHTIAILLFLVSSPAWAEKGTYQRLYAERADASSFLRSNWNKYVENYHPNYALDDNPKTAWVEGSKGNGENESLTAHVSALPSARKVKLRLRNGYQKSTKLFRANARPAKVRLALLQKETPHSVREITLKDTEGWQDVEFPVDQNKGFDAVKITLVSTVDGTRYHDTCLSDLQIWVDSAVPYLADVEKRKETRLRAWIKERVDKAAYFAKLPATYPLAHTEFIRDKQLEIFDEELLAEGKPLASAVESLEKGKTPKPLGKAVSEADLAEMKRLLARFKALDDSGPYYRRTPKVSFEAPAGVDWQEGVAWVGKWGMSALRRDDFSLVEVKKRWAYRLFEGGDSGTVESMTNVRKASSHTGLELAVTWNRTFHERVTTEESKKLLLVYGTTGRLDRVLVITGNDTDMAEFASSIALVDITWASDKIERFTVKSVGTVVDTGTGMGPEVLSNRYSRNIFDGVPQVAAK